MMWISERIVRKGTSLLAGIFRSKASALQSRASQPLCEVSSESKVYDHICDWPRGLTDRRRHPEHLLFWPFEINTTLLDEGLYRVAIRSAESDGESKEFIVLDDESYEAMLRSVSTEGELGTTRRLAGVPEDQWLYSWRLVEQYLGNTPDAGHITVTVRKSSARWGRLIAQVMVTDVSPNPPKNRSDRERRDILWLNFHVNRFVFGQLFCGGQLNVTIDDASTLSFKLKLQSVRAFADHLPDDLVKLSSTFGKKVSLVWSSSTGLLEVAWH